MRSMSAPRRTFPRNVRPSWRVPVCLKTRLDDGSALRRRAAAVTRPLLHAVPERLHLPLERDTMIELFPGRLVLAFFNNLLRAKPRAAPSTLHASLARELDAVAATTLLFPGAWFFLPPRTVRVSGIRSTPERGGGKRSDLPPDKHAVNELPSSGYLAELLECEPTTCRDAMVAFEQVGYHLQDHLVIPADSSEFGLKTIDFVEQSGHRQMLLCLAAEDAVCRQLPSRRSRLDHVPPNA
jgi:hypothetical protein